MVREQEVGGQMLTDRRRVGADEALTIRDRDVLHPPGLEVFVAVDDEDGKDASDVGADDRRATEVVAAGMGLLAEQRDLVAELRPRTRERACIDIGAGTSQEISVPEENLHRRGS